MDLEQEHIEWRSLLQQVKVRFARSPLYMLR